MESGTSDEKKMDEWDPSGIDAMVDAYNDEHTHLDRASVTNSEKDEDTNMAGEDTYASDLAMYDGAGDEPMYSDSGLSSVDEVDDKPETKPSTVTSLALESDASSAAKSGRRSIFVTCVQCGKVGSKSSFKGKSKSFCSFACSRKGAVSSAWNKTKKPAKRKSADRLAKLQVKEETLSATPPAPTEIFAWSVYLSESNAEAVPVSSFQHVPMWDCWENINVGVKVEVDNSDTELKHQVYWIATIVRIAGYNAKLRYEGFGADNSLDFWKNLCSEEVHPVGWCSTMGKPLVPPLSIQQKYLDWKEFLVKRLTGARTLPLNFYEKVQESIHNTQLKLRMRVEVVDKMWVSAMRVARVVEIHGGRCKLQYEASSYDDNDFWIHERSPLVHYVGWSQAVGHKIHANADYKLKSMKKLSTNQFADADATPSHFDPLPSLGYDVNFTVGMKLEAVDPLNLSAICPATVMKVLNNGYIMIGIDGQMASNGSDLFAFHGASPLIFPVGFCEKNHISMTAPKDYVGDFKWPDYLMKTGSMAAPEQLFEKAMPKHGFCVGMKIEAVDLMEPRLICVASIGRVVGRLLRVHFDSWEETYDQWVDCNSPDIYPVGWSEMIGYALEGPPDRFAPGVAAKKKKKPPKLQKSPLMAKKRKKKPSPSKSMTSSLSLADSDQSGESTNSSHAHSRLTSQSEDSIKIVLPRDSSQLSNAVENNS